MRGARGLKILRRIAEEVLGPEKARIIWARIDLIGDIAVIKKPITYDIPLEDLRRVAEELVTRIPYIKSVWLAATPVSGEYKLRSLIHLAGEERSTTIYKEHGCRFLVDVARVFITPRLSYEHLRIARQVKAGETIVNMFAGAGLFSIVIACKARPQKVYSIDLNRYAYELMKKNVELNKVEDIVVPIHGDAAKIVEERLQGIADRVLMPLPDLAIKYLPYALKALKDKGTIHVYLHVHAPRGVNPVGKAWERVKENLAVDAKLLYGRIVRPVGPRRYQVVLDIEAEPNG